VLFKFRQFLFGAVMYPLVCRIVACDGNRGTEITNGTLTIASCCITDAPIYIRLGITRIEIDNLIVISDGAVIIAF
jgi:hypothetical protein